MPYCACIHSSRRCPFVRARLALASVPSFLGGKCSCANGCVNGTIGAADHPEPSNHQQLCGYGLTTHVVPARGTHEVFLDVQAGSSVAYAVQVQAGMQARVGRFVCRGGEAARHGSPCCC